MTMLLGVNVRLDPIEEVQQVLAAHVVPVQRDSRLPAVTIPAWALRPTLSRHWGSAVYQHSNSQTKTC